MRRRRQPRQALPPGGAPSVFALPVSSPIFLFFKQETSTERQAAKTEAGEVTLLGGTRLRICAESPRETMLRVLVYVTLLAVLFGGAVLWAGNAIGSWEPAHVPLHAPGASAPETTKAKKHHHGKHQARPPHKHKHH
jgi:hypothetical protein